MDGGDDDAADLGVLDDLLALSVDEEGESAVPALRVDSNPDASSSDAMSAPAPTVVALEDDDEARPLPQPTLAEPVSDDPLHPPPTEDTTEPSGVGDVSELLGIQVSLPALSVDIGVEETPGNIDVVIDDGAAPGAQPAGVGITMPCRVHEDNEACDEAIACGGEPPAVPGSHCGESSLGPTAPLAVGSETSPDDDAESTATMTPPPSPPLDGLPPPAPSRATPEIIGTMHPTDGLDEDDSDSDDDGATAPLLQPLELHGPLGGGDSEDELEVDAEVAKSIRSAKSPPPRQRQEPHEQPPVNALLEALNAVNAVNESANFDASPGHGLGDPFATEVREATPSEAHKVLAHPESSEKTFGIAYQNLRQRSQRAPHEILKLHYTGERTDLEGDELLASDVSFSVKRRDLHGDRDKDERIDDVPTDDDEFGASIDENPLSPSRISEILERRTTQLASDDEIAQELKLATSVERKQLRIETQVPATTPLDSTRPDENALTLKELHSIYKRGLGDQEVRLLDEDPDVRPHARNAENHPPSTTTLRGSSVMKQAIDEGNEDEEDGEDDETPSASTFRAKANRDDPANELDQCVDALVEDPIEDDDDPDKGDDGWNEVALQHSEPTTHSTIQSQKPKASHTSSSGITHNEAVAHLMNSSDVLQHRDHIVAEELAPNTSCFGCFARPRLTFPRAIDERDRVFCIAATPFNPHDEVHVRMLLTIYRKIMRGQSDVPLVGSHWESIGFQGTDPATDLRGCGVLSLVQMLYLVESHPELATKLHSQSQHPTRHFPMACALINVTLQCLLALRTGSLYRECNKHNSVLGGLNSLFVCLTAQLAQEVHASAHEVPLVMKRVLDHGRMHPDQVIAAAQSIVGLKGASSTSPRKASAARASSHVEFSEIALQSAADN